MNEFIWCCESSLGMTQGQIVERLIEYGGYDLTNNYELWYVSEDCDIHPVPPNTVLGEYYAWKGPRHEPYRGGRR